MTSSATPLSNASPSTATSPIDLSGTIPFGSVRACGRGGCVKVPLRMHRSMLVLVILVAINGILNISVDIGMGLAIFVYGVRLPVSNHILSSPACGHSVPRSRD